MSKTKQQIKVILLDPDGKLVNIARDAPTDLQQRQYMSTLKDSNATSCTFDWYDAQALDAKYLENYGCSFVSTAANFLNEPIGFGAPQKPNPYYFTQCQKCLCIILTNRDIGKRLVSVNPEPRCNHYNYTQALPTTEFMGDALEIMNEHLHLLPHDDAQNMISYANLCAEIKGDTTDFWT
ncbi:unnamed protein product [Rotaria magnacalcarata]|uniref:Uncharacterized protein n=3 Tax=Rotaria magnacalcarata TaxID=392030 RepID=A0A816HCB7_9BILA|nr:unnamed protein product [Rotaria magnacalcarata]CAF4764290.1 unnamed protein product [Rotaria magnacalcarata]